MTIAFVNNIIESFVVASYNKGGIGFGFQFFNNGELKIIDICPVFAFGIRFWRNSPKNRIGIFNRFKPRGDSSSPRKRASGYQLMPEENFRRLVL